MAQIKPNESIRYEDQVPDETVLALHQLCPQCLRFQNKSRMLSDFHHSRPVIHGTEEEFALGPIEELKAGYLSGCHLCALIWEHAGGYLMDPSKPRISASEVVICLRARNKAIEDREPGLWRMMQNVWWKQHPPSIGDAGFIDAWIPAVKSFKNYGGFISLLYIYKSTDPNVNQISVKDAPEPISSKHELKLSYIQEMHRECSEYHSKCKLFPQLVSPNGQMPSRLVDVQGDIVRLECNVNSRIDYTTLSHMWGLDKTIKLELNVLEAFKVEIPKSDLPTKYLEAIRVTKALGFRYIWIDSLCIIQDSKQDWETESVKMASVYGRTSCNISYVYPPSDDTDKKHVRDPRLRLPCRLSPPGPTRDTSLIVQSTEPPLRRQWSARSSKLSWPLLSRAWVFQERLLCPRNIYYGSDILFWECCETLEDEFWGPVVLTEGTKADFYTVFSGDSSDGGWYDTFIGQWFTLVQGYRLNNLTKETDRGVAFAGIAQAIQNQAQLTYLAGVWREFGELGLVWHLEPLRHGSADYAAFCRRKEEMDADAPSWSWFSVPTMDDAKTQVDTVYSFLCSELHARSSLALYKARIVSFHHPRHVSSDPSILLRDFRGMSITLRAVKIWCTLKWDKEVLRVLPLGQLALGATRWTDAWEAMSYYHDDLTLEPGSELPAEACMVVTMLNAWTMVGGKEVKYEAALLRGKNPGWQYAGLVVVPAGGRNWKRIGAFMFTNESREETQEFQVPFDWENGQEDVILV